MYVIYLLKSKLKGWAAFQKFERQNTEIGIKSKQSYKQFVHVITLVTHAAFPMEIKDKV